MSSFETQERGSDRMLTEVANDLRGRHPGLDMTTGRLSARPPAALSAEASEADLLVLGSRGLSRTMVFFIHSFDIATISGIERPVILVRATNRPDDEPPPPY
ncbi:universal stress protein [Streptomyces sp. NPDC087538]|uniref:universal stress protein n=1 Tax=Streptomyces sp. NPDC087538 TaxID=3365797 RepID=UPI00382AE12C